MGGSKNCGVSGKLPKRLYDQIRLGMGKKLSMAYKMVAMTTMQLLLLLPPLPTPPPPLPPLPPMPPPLPMPIA